MALIDQPTHLSLTISRALGRVVVGVHGELDVATSPRFQGTLARLIEEQGELDIILDLRPLTFIDSTALRVLLYAQRTLDERGGTLTLSAPRSGVLRVLEMTGLTGLLAPDPAAARPPAAAGAGLDLSADPVA